MSSFIFAGSASINDVLEINAYYGQKISEYRRQESLGADCTQIMIEVKGMEMELRSLGYTTREYNGIIMWTIPDGCQAPSSSSSSSPPSVSPSPPISYTPPVRDSTDDLLEFLALPEFTVQDDPVLRVMRMEEDAKLAQQIADEDQAELDRLMKETQVSMDLMQQIAESDLAYYVRRAEEDDRLLAQRLRREEEERLQRIEEDAKLAKQIADEDQAELDRNVRLRMMHSTSSSARCL